jgi:catechol 2,3-dioxygenase-like lactoylglutathione lyase family enzyme
MSYTKTRVDRLRHIGLCAPDAAAAATFYTDSWGLEMVTGKPGEPVMLRGTSREHHILELVDHPVHKIHHLEFGCADRATLDQLYAELMVKGIPVLNAPHTFDRTEGGYGFELLDPERRLLRISADITLHSVGQEISSRPSKISHIVLNSTDPEKMQQFYCEVLGFVVSDRLEDQMVFIRCNDQGHHQIAFFRNIHASLNHVSFEMATQKSVEQGIERLQKNGTPILWGKGCHGIGKVMFTYFKDPNGFVIEYSHYTEGFDASHHEAQTWTRTPDIMDTWKTAGLPSPDVRAAMLGAADAGYEGTAA